MIRHLSIVALALTACASTPRNPQSAVEREINACLPAAITMREALVKSGVWSEVLVATWSNGNGKRRGHAYAVYLYPPGKNQLWTYDSWGSYRSRAYKNNPLAVAKTANYQRNLPTTQLTAEYLK